MKFDAIVVLGAGVTKKGNLTRVCRSRVDKAVELFLSGMAPRIIVAGKGEACVMKSYAVRKGLTEADILEEDKSLDTVGNAFFVKRDFLLRNDWHRLAVVTSGFHLRRAKLVFRKVFGKGYTLTFVASQSVLLVNALKQKLYLEKGLTVLTGILGMLVADGDMDAIENFVLKNPLYAVYRRV